ncbi:RNA polymerase, sigma-24 subunit, ECF subfamily [Caldicellulosiruptor acetigenus I77R1B]|uniref:RNA polymerase, sigma-24 subunit, ECF subfamily n=2 Tax=Caldicellulosiruptor acetigenus TaxID=301953 RepID=G2PWF8_9FIRM|nr:sigma-70 family RNA polymerase sigma factor [Caldicellulosiruptor acetigenus]ADQ41691.1 RNA polymerase, sigma-24 subunit, ECF subfamily [Caldicellulosiruptor acetigenus I77R1B]AEM72902.1 RNA polymerase, sigma-24 subunit, ECF subfamily [Caldicellulosiruptor acetigenus 6A]WAM35909.1 sigma-70 family RNA polymerase sigma factor [Caldicellulosiruptor acetigenus]
MDERELVEKAKKDKKYFEKLYEMYFDKIYSYIYYRTFNHPITEDLTSETFMKVLRSLDRFEWKENGSFSAWIFRIAQNVVNDYYRSKKEFVDIEKISDSSWLKNPEDELLDKVEKDIIKSALSKLTKDQQEVVILRYSANMKFHEIAKVKNKSDVAVRALFFRAMHSLKEMLLKEVHESE